MLNSGRLKSPAWCLQVEEETARMAVDAEAEEEFADME